MPKLGTVDIDGRTFEIEVTEAGEFRCYHAGDWYEATSKKALVEKLKTYVRTHARLAVPATVFTINNRDKVQFKQVIIVGVHGRNRNVMYREERDQSKPEQEGYSDQFCPRLTGEQIQEAVTIYRAMREATRAWEAWREAHTVNPRELIAEAVAALEQTPVETT